MWMAGVVFTLGNRVVGLLAYLGFYLPAIVVGVLTMMATLAIVGMKLGERFETVDLGWGSTEAGLGPMLRAQLTPSWLGAWLGLVPFLLFVGALLVAARH